MLSDEEKAVLKTAKENYGLTSAEQKILVNLIEKQSKEIEELKREKTIYYYEWRHLEANIINKIEYYEKIDNPVGKRVLQSLLEKE